MSGIKEVEPDPLTTIPDQIGTSPGTVVPDQNGKIYHSSQQPNIKNKKREVPGALMAEIESDQLPPAFHEEDTKVKSEDEEEEECILQFLDSLDTYLTLVDSLSSSLRQGWFDLASARQSMGHTRVSSKLFDHKVHSAPTTVKVTELHVDNLSDPKLQFYLSKWATTKQNPPSEVPNDSNLRHRGPTGVLEDGRRLQAADEDDAPASDVISNDVNLVQKERSKSLTVFGALVSPKLRTAQVSFETALDKMVDIANARSTMLSCFSRLQLKKKCPT